METDAKKKKKTLLRAISIDINFLDNRHSLREKIKIYSVSSMPLMFLKEQGRNDVKDFPSVVLK